VVHSDQCGSPLAAMPVYKQLWTVERTFRTAKGSARDAADLIRACSFLALVLKKEPEDHIAAAGKRRPRLVACRHRR
jgi:hypothetical protein